MENSIIKYDTLELDNYIVQDYTSKKIYNIYNLKEIDDPIYIDYYILNDDEKIEGISYKLYNSSRYWDIILLINRKDPLFDMVYNFDIIGEMSEKFIQWYDDNIYTSKDLPSWYKQQLTEEEILEREKLNEQNRIIKIIRPGKLNDFMKILRKNEII